MGATNSTTASPASHKERLRRAALWALSILLVVTMSGMANLGAASAAQAQEGDAGYRGPSFGESSGFQPTRDKPQSKLWFNDGIWWASMYNPDAGAYNIHRYEEASKTWTDTGTLIDKREGSRADALWDGENLYIATAGQTQDPADSGKVLRYSYNAATNSYSLDEGFPVTVTDGGMEALVIDKDTDGTLWVTYTQNRQVYVNHSLENQNDWGAPFVPNVEGTNVSPDDISSLVSYDLDTEAPKIGLMWSNQREDAIYFASHKDNEEGERVWESSKRAVTGPNSADDHINLKSLQSDAEGRVFAAVKTERDRDANPDPDAPQVILSVLGHDGTFTNYTFGRVKDEHTRPNVVIDKENSKLYMFATAPTGGGAIYYKETPLDNISFEEGLGKPFIKSSQHPNVNDPTSSKQALDSESDLMVLAADDTTGYYLFNIMRLGDAPDTIPPETSIVSGPEGTINTASAEFTFASSEEGSDFECSLDGAAFEGCSSPKEYTNLSDGSHTFKVRATDASGNPDPTPASREFTVDATTPTVTEVTPQDGSSGIAPDSNVTATFSKNMDPDTLNADTFTLAEEGGEPVEATVAYEDSERKATLDPAAGLKPGTTYRATIKGGPEGAKDASGNALAEDEVWTFQTESTEEPSPGPEQCTITGTEGDDTLNGTPGEDVICGLAGNDILRGYGSDDTLLGGDGNDSLGGFADNDELRGEAGDDTAVGGDGDDRLFGDDGNDDLRGSLGNDLLAGFAGSDVLFGARGTDEIRGGTEDDSLRGGFSEDLTIGGRGNDVLIAGRGPDTLFGSFGEDILGGNIGRDDLRGNQGDDRLDGGPNKDLLVGGVDNDTLFGRGNDDRLFGNAGTDTLDGGVGTDDIRGNTGNDDLIGGRGPDFLFGGQDDDRLDSTDGESGNDEVGGGPGTDACRADEGDTVRSCEN